MIDQETLEVARLAVAGSTPQRADTGAQFVVVPDAYRVQDLEHLLDAPMRKKGMFSMLDADSFCRFIAANLTPDTRLYGNRLAPSFRAVFNDHGTGPGWRDFGANYACPLSVEWKLWTGANKRQMNQETFAQFIEDNAPDCVSPDSATMIEISRTLVAKKKVSFASSVRLDSGQHALTYEEEISGTAGKGKIQIPETFQIGISVLEGGPRYAVYARLRYRIGDKGALSLWYDLDRPHKVLEDAAAEVWRDIAETTGLPIFNGG